MATVRLSDVYVPEVYRSYTAVNNTETTGLLQAGIIQSNPVFDEIARGGGKQVEVPFWNDIDPTIEPNYSNDDPADLAVANKIGTGTMNARKTWVNQGFSEMDLVKELAGEEALQHIRNRFETYWQRQLNRRVIAMSVGVMADNVANDASDMVTDISAEAGEDAVFGSNAFIDAAYTSGDQAENYRGIAVHSAIMARMVKNDEIVMIPDSEGRLTIPTYMGRVVVVDDGLPVSAGVFTSILFGGGAIGFGGVEGSAYAVGTGVPKVADEVFRSPHAGNGGGMEEIWERKTWMLHPFGFNWINDNTLTEFSPTLADLRLASHWDRKVSRKQVPLAFIKARAKVA